MPYPKIFQRYIFLKPSRERMQTAARKLGKRHGIYPGNVVLIFFGGLSIPRLFSIENMSQDDKQPSKRHVSV